MKTELVPAGTIEAVRYFTNSLGTFWKFENGKMQMLIIWGGDEWCDSAFKCPNELLKERTGVREINEKEAMELMNRKPDDQPENQPSKWHRFGEFERKIGRPIWAWDGKRIGQFEGIGGDIEFTVTGWTHWQYAEVPEPPTVNQDEEAFNNWNKGLSNCNESARRAWFAALEYARTTQPSKPISNKPNG